MHSGVVLEFKMDALSQTGGGERESTVWLRYWIAWNDYRLPPPPRERHASRPPVVPSQSRQENPRSRTLQARTPKKERYLVGTAMKCGDEK
ncbi:unnamed protein product [Nezara viridula]|uniref:Uncharacterized protein n=1 Tax=Nezara viridula TaxID=85310 RepID=A0A9P0MH03_NEZVI|nr:unnamed protein product [Nezara viridula]